MQSCEVLRDAGRPSKHCVGCVPDPGQEHVLHSQPDRVVSLQEVQDMLRDQKLPQSCLTQPAGQTCFGALHDAYEASRQLAGLCTQHA